MVQNKQISDLFKNAAPPPDEGCPALLRNVLAYDGNGKLFVASSDGRIRCADVRQQLVSGEWARDGGSGGSDDTGTALPSSGYWPVRSIRPEPAHGLQVTHLEVNRSGTYALVAGYKYEDPDSCHLVLLDLSSSRPAPADGGERVGGGPGVGAGNSSSNGGGGDGGGGGEVCDSLCVDPGLWGGRQGMRLWQVSWHPHSDMHFAALSSDNTWRLYCVADITSAEQTYELMLRDPRRRGLTEDDTHRQAVAFDFGGHTGWDWFTIYFAASDGCIFTMCPVAPFGGSCPAPVARRLVALHEESGGERANPTTQAWLQRALPGAGAVLASEGSDEDDYDFPSSSSTPAARVAAGGNGHGGGPSVVRIAAHGLEEHCPALAGPLRVVALDEEEDEVSRGGGSGSGRSVLDYSEAEDDTVAALCMLRYGGNLSALCVASQAGCLAAYVVASDAAPCWGQCASQVMDKEPYVATWYQVPLAPSSFGGANTASAAAAGDSDYDDTSSLPSLPGGFGAGRGEAGHRGNGSTTGGCLVLMDVADLGMEDNLDAAAAAAADPSDYGGGCAGVEEQAAVRLLRDAAAADRLYVCGPRSSWAVSLPWLPVLSDLLGDAADPSDLIIDQATGGGGGSLPPLPPLSCVEVASIDSTDAGEGGGAFVGAAAAGDTLTGCALVLLPEEGGPMACWPPAVGPSGGGSWLAAEGEAPRTPEQVSADVEQQVQRLYSGLLTGPGDQPPLPTHPVGAVLTTATPEGQRHLNASITALRERYVEYVHHAAHDLTERLDAIEAQRAKQRSAAGELSVGCDDAESRQERLESRLERAARFHQNLLDRLKLLAELHLSLPGSLSLEERSFREVQLPALEAQERALRSEVQQLQGRARGVAGKLRAAQQGASPGGFGAASRTLERGTAPSSRFTPVPLAQMRKVREALAESTESVAKAQAKLDRLEEQLRAEEAKQEQQ